MSGQGSGLFLSTLDRDRADVAAAGKAVFRLGQRVVHSTKEAAMNTSRVTSVFLTIVLMLIGSSYVSSEPGVAVNERTGVEDSHVEYYRQHVASLGIESPHCK